MAIRRKPVKPEEHYTIIANDWIRDTRLSLKARGLLALVLSHRVGWNVTIESLAQQNPEGKAAIRSAVKELEAAGYLEREITHREDGKFAGYDYVLTYDPDPLATPEPSSENRTTAPTRANTDPEECSPTSEPLCGEPSSREPSSDNPSSDNRTQRRTVIRRTREQEEQSEESAPTGDAPTPWDAIAKRAYDATHGALKYMAVRSVALWAIETRGTDPDTVEHAIADLHYRGKPVTRALVDQWLNGALDRAPAWAMDNNARMAAAARQAAPTAHEQAALEALDGFEATG